MILLPLVFSATPTTFFQTYEKTYWKHFHWNHKDTLQETNISPKHGILKMILLFPKWDMLIPWRVLDERLQRYLMSGYHVSHVLLTSCGLQVGFPSWLQRRQPNFFGKFLFKQMGLNILSPFGWWFFVHPELVFVMFFCGGVPQNALDHWSFAFFFLNGSESYFRKDFLNSVTCHTDSPDMTTCEPCQATVFIGFLQYFVSWCKKDGAWGSLQFFEIGSLEGFYEYSS